MPNIFILAERRDEGLHPISFELVSAARQLMKDQGGRMDVALLGHELGSLTGDLLAAGVDAVHVVEDPLLDDYTTDAYLNIVGRLIGLMNPEIVLIGQTSMGRDLAPRLAFRVKGAVAMDCLDLAIDSATGSLIVTRPIYGGSLQASYRFGQGASPRIVTIRSKAFEPAGTVTGPVGRITVHSADPDSLRVRTKTLEKKSLMKAGEARLEDADIIVSGGWGLGKKENYQIIEALAKAIGGSPGASRPICDLEWTDASRHIGLTGKIVAPNLYMAVAISGAMHHVAGCSNAKVIVGVNIDPKAPIFKYAKYGVVGDYAEIVPALIRELEKPAGG